MNKFVGLETIEIMDDIKRMMEETEFWELCLDKFSKKLTNQQINTWIKPLSFKASKNQSTIYAPNQFVLEWVKE